MKKFRFPLESVRALRRRAWERAEETLLRIMAEERQLARRRKELAGETLAECQRTLEKPELEAAELVQLERLRDWAAAEDRRLERRQQEARRRAAEQRARVVEARRQYEVLESLRERQYEAWVKETNREEEKAVAEMVAARWKEPDAE
jgi:flagellar export protein FliJ